MKPFIIVLTVVFILSLAYGGYESFRTSRANKKAQEAMLLNKDYIQKIDIERAKQEVSRAYAETVDKDIVDIIAFNDVIDKKLTLDLAKSLKVKVPSSEVNAQYEELESSMGDKEQFRRMLQVQGLTKDSLKNKIEESYNKCLNLFKEGKRDTEEYKKELDNLETLLKKISEETRAKKELQLKKLEKIESKLKKGRVSSAEAIEARRNPKLSTIKDINKLSHRAGLEGAKYGAAIGGIMSIINNTVAVCRGEKSMSEAIKHVALDTGVSGEVGYISTYTGAAIKGVMQNSSNAYIRTISNTGLPGIMVSATLASGKVLNRYLKGEIDGVQCLQELGQENMNMISSSLYAVIGQALIPIPVVGGIVGGMMGYALSSATFSLLKNALEEEKLAKENRILIEKACAEHIQKMQDYKRDLEEFVNKYIAERIDLFNESLTGGLDALNIDDTEWFVDSCNSITKQYGGDPLVDSQEEFNRKMISKDVFVL